MLQIIFLNKLICTTQFKIYDDLTVSCVFIKNQKVIIFNYEYNIWSLILFRYFLSYCIIFNNDISIQLIFVYLYIFLYFYLYEFLEKTVNFSNTFGEYLIIIL